MKTFPKRKTIRLREYDYSQANYYHITICTVDNKRIFGMGNELTKFGLIVEDQINEIQQHYKNISVEKYVIMPNHIHMIVVISASDDGTKQPMLGNIVGAFKAGVSREIHKIDSELNIWQSRFYDHIIKDDVDHENVWTYIDENPIKWENDEYY